MEVIQPDEGSLAPLTVHDWNLQVEQWLPNGYVLLRDTDDYHLELYLSTGYADTGTVVIHGMGYVYLRALPATMPPLPPE